MQHRGNSTIEISNKQMFNGYHTEWPSRPYHTAIAVLHTGRHLSCFCLFIGIGELSIYGVLHPPNNGPGGHRAIISAMARADIYFVLAWRGEGGDCAVQGRSFGNLLRGGAPLVWTLHGHWGKSVPQGGSIWSSVKIFGGWRVDCRRSLRPHSASM